MGKIVSIIPARGGSKGIPRKNLVELDGHPLIYYSIIPSLNSCVDLTVVSTDDDEIVDVASALGATVVERPGILGGDLVPTEPVVVHVVGELELDMDDVVVLLQPTSPIRCGDLIDGCVGEYTGLVSTVPVPRGNAIFTAHYEKYYHWMRDRVCEGCGHAYKPWHGAGFDFSRVRQPRQVTDMDVRENGNIFVTNAASYISHNRFGTDPVPHITHPLCGMELDEPWQVPVLDSVLRMMREEVISWDDLLTLEVD